MIDIEKVKNNIENLSKELPSLKIDSILIEQENEIKKLEFKEEQLHELRSCAKLLVSMTIGIAMEKHFKIGSEELSLETKVYYHSNGSKY